MNIRRNGNSDRRKILNLPVLIVSAFAGTTASALASMDELYQDFTSGQYETVYKGLVEYRTTHPATSLVDYMLGVSACKTNRQDWGHKQLTVARAQYRAAEPDRDKRFADALEDCIAAKPPAKPAGAGGRMKIDMSPVRD